MEAALDDAPDAQAEFHFTIGDTYRSLLMWPEAAGHLEKALERYRAVDGAELEVARCLEVYGLVLSELDPPRALPMQEEALELRRDALDDGHVDVAASERSLAIALLSQYADQDDEGARALLLSALAKHTAAVGPRHPEVAATKFWLGRLANRDGRPLDGKRLFEEAVAIFEQADPVDPQLVDALAALAGVHRRLDDFEAAKTHLDRAVKLTSELYGDERDVEMLRAYANLHFDQGDNVTAERLSRQAVVKELERWARKRPEDAARIAGVRRRLQITEAAGGEPPYAEAFAILREFRGNGAFELASWANGIAGTLLPQDRGAATEPLLREVLNIRCRAFGMSCPNRVSTLLLLAQVLADQDRQAEAVPLLEEVLTTLERVGEAAGSRGDEARALLERCRTLAVDRAG
jgi:tetratricopeptide (TPR) repeat protein